MENKVYQSGETVKISGQYSMLCKCQNDKRITRELQIGEFFPFDDGFQCLWCPSEEEQHKKSESSRMN